MDLASDYVLICAPSLHNCSLGGKRLQHIKDGQKKHGPMQPTGTEFSRRAEHAQSNLNQIVYDLVAGFLESAGRQCGRGVKKRSGLCVTISTAELSHGSDLANSLMKEQHRYTIPSPLILDDGTAVGTPGDWRQRRRRELILHWTGILGKLSPSKADEKWCSRLVLVWRIQTRLE